VQDASIDLVVTLGGDGTVLYASWLFQCKMPPLVSFHLGSLGFLTVFDYSDYKRVLHQVIDGGGVHLNIRMRIQCGVYRRADKCEASNSPTSKDDSPEHDVLDHSHRDDEPVLTQQFEVLNELVVDRGSASVMLEVALVGASQDVLFPTVRLCVYFMVLAS
jgi:NAD+ kinase